MNLYLLSLLVHITGLTLLGGTTLIGYTVERRFWKLYGPERARALAAHEVARSFGPIAGIGAALLLLSGVALMVQTKGVFGEQLWFRIKMGVVLLLIANSIVTGRLRKKTGVAIANDEGGAGMRPALARLERSTMTAYLLQLAMVLAIFVLGVFKFN